MGAEPARPVPVVDDLTREFWTGGERGELRITACAECGRLFHPPGPICPSCHCRRITYVVVSGSGTVDSFTVVRRPWIDGYETPYVVARVRLRDQPDVVLLSNIVGVDPEEVRMGMDVEAVFETRAQVQVPVFRPTR